MRHVTLVRPPALVARHSAQGALTPPIGYAYLAGSLLEAGHEVTIVDAVGEAPFKSTPLFDNKIMASGLLKDEIVNLIPEHTDFIGVSCMFSQDWPYAKQVIDSIRACFPDVTILAGGEHIIAMPEFVLETCPAIDYCILGEGEETLVALVNNLNASLPDEEINGIAYMRDGDFIKTPPRARIRNIDDIPLPAWHLVPLENYLDNGLGYGVNRGRSMPMLATRGCPYRCTFCSSPFMWTTAWLARKPELVLDEIQYYIEKYSIILRNTIYLT